METKPRIVLSKGGHGDEFDPAHAATCPRCLFEAYNWIKRQEFTDSRPPGVSSALHIFGMRLNDCLPDQPRQALARYLPNGQDPLAGTENDGHEETRGYMALDWLIRTYLLRFLELSPRLAESAAAVKALARIDNMDAAQAAGPVVTAAGAAAWDAAWDAAGDAAWDAAGDAAWDAAWDAAGDAARDAAWDAAWAAAWAAPWAAAWAAPWAAAGAAARAAARDAEEEWQLVRLREYLRGTRDEPPARTPPPRIHPPPQRRDLRPLRGVPPVRR